MAILDRCCYFSEETGTTWSSCGSPSWAPGRRKVEAGLWSAAGKSTLEPGFDLDWTGVLQGMFNCLSFLFMQIIWRWTLVISPIQHQTSKSIPDRTNMKVARTCQRTINSDGKHCTPQETGLYGNFSQKGGRGGGGLRFLYPSLPDLDNPGVRSIGPGLLVLLT